MDFRRVPMLLLLLPLVAAICLIYYFKPNLLLPAEPTFIHQRALYQAVVLTCPDERTNWMRFEAQLTALPTDSTPSETAHVQCYIAKDSLAKTIRQGDILLLDTRPTHYKTDTLSPRSFDYNRHLRLQGISAVCFTREDHYRRVGHTQLHSLRAIAERQQQRVVRCFRQYDFSVQELGVLTSLTVGERGLLDPTVRQHYSAAGAMHVLAVSGLHVGIIYGVLLWLLTGFGLLPVLYKQRWRRWMNFLITVLILWSYAFLTGLSPSVVRSALMFSLFAFAPLLDRETNSFNIVFASAFLTLMVSPLSLFSVSFQLSYAAVFAILYFQPKLRKILYFRHKTLRYIWDLLTLSVAAQIGTLPISWYYFHQVSTYFALTNLIVVPAASIIIYLAITLLLLSPTALSLPVAWLLNKTLWLTNQYVAFVDSLPYSTIHYVLQPVQLVLLLLTVACLALYAHKQRWQYILATAALLALILVCCWQLCA